MESVIRGLLLYTFLLLVFRLAGKRTLAQSTNFELVLLLIISETTQQAMVDEDHSITNGLLLILTLMACTISLSLLKQRYRTLEKWLDDVPLVIFENGHMHKDRMDKLRVDEGDILAAARQHQGLQNLDEIKYAVVERNGKIAIIPKRTGKSG
ncbi:MAG: DUF421 domain-containing protein [Verrucomicrobia subdivision 3 bacterium]|nr:DUF421 domain-containing protein [Limisphaerales bacterium]